jgi:hypothetical protein
MSQERTLTRPPRQTEAETPTAPSNGGGGTALRDQAAGYRQAAREAYDQCEHGADAERELQRRAQQGGQ